MNSLTKENFIFFPYCYKYWILNDHNDTLITRSLIIYADYNVIHYVHQLRYHLCKGFWSSHYKPINRPNQHEIEIIIISSEFSLVSSLFLSNSFDLQHVALDISGNNYLSWVLDAEIHLHASNLGETIKENNSASLQDRAKALIFLHHHLDESLKNEYLTVKDLLVL